LKGYKEMSENTMIGKIAKAALEVGGKLGVDKRNNEQKYDYISADKILSICGQALFTQGIVVIPAIVKSEQITVDRGNGKYRYDCQVDFQITVTDGTIPIVSEWRGMGSDYTVPDKALYKAITSGHKYFLMKLLCIGAGNEDGEHDDEPQPAPVKLPPASVKDPSTMTRPYSPEVLKQKIASFVSIFEKSGEKPTAGQRSIVPVNIEQCFAPNPDAENIRHSVTKYLTGKVSTNDFTDAEILAFRKWLNVQKDSGGAWLPDPMAEKEANLVWRAANVEAGQGDLFE